MEWVGLWVSFLHGPNRFTVVGCKLLSDQLRLPPILRIVFHHRKFIINLLTTDLFEPYA